VCVRDALQTGTLYTDESGALCKIVCDDGDVYTVSSSIRGKLIEVNERLLSEPQLLADKVHSFLCRILLFHYTLVIFAVLHTDTSRSITGGIQ